MLTRLRKFFKMTKGGFTSLATDSGPWPLNAFSYMEARSSQKNGLCKIHNYDS